jgi:hypothetical protein
MFTMDCDGNGIDDVLFHVRESDLIFLWCRLYWSEWSLVYWLY